MEIKLTEDECMEIFYTALCNAVGSGYMDSYGLQFEYNEEEYTKSSKKLRDSGKTGICMEDVWMQMLIDGYTLSMIDVEGEGDNDSTINKKNIIERVPKVPTRFLSQMINEQDDAETADVVIQTVFFNEVIFG